MTPGDEQIQSSEDAARTGKLGMMIFLASLSMLFAGSFVGYLVVRLRAESWRAPDMPPLPWGLWLSTLVLIACSIFIHQALKAARKNDQAALKRSLLIGFFLGLAFLVNQTINWVSLISLNLPPNSRNLYAFTFYMLTGLHAVHVIGGLIQLGVVFRKATRGAYTISYHPGVLYSAMYWHFLDIVWLIMFFAMMILS